MSISGTGSVDTAVFTVGGLGTRFLPATKALPKEMLPVVDKPLIQYAVEEAKEAGIEYFVFVTGRGKTAIEDHFDAHPYLETALTDRGKHDLAETINGDRPEPGHLVYVRQAEPLGLGHAVWCARKVVGNRPFALFLPDDLIRGNNGPCIGELIDVHAEHGGNVLSVMEVDREATSQYGIVDSEPGSKDVMRIRRVVEKPSPADAPSRYAIIGRYVLDPTVFDHLATATRGAGNEIQLTDAIESMIPTTPLHGVVLNGRRYDCGTKVGYIEANVALGLERSDLAQDVERVVRDALDRHTSLGRVR